MSSSDVVAEEYASSLSDLVANSKPLINMLTMLAEENIDHAPAIVQAVERHLQQVRSDIKLPVLYLIDSIVKNVGQQYLGLFTQNIVSTFCSVFEKVDERTRSQMFKLRQTWNDVFPAKKLYAMDVRVSSIDPAWPITAPVPTSIHINPRFFPQQGNTPASIVPNVIPSSGAAMAVAPAAAIPTIAVATAAGTASAANNSTVEDPQAIVEARMREELLKKQKQLLELQQKKLELELMQTKAKLVEQQKQLEKQTDHLHVQQLLLPPVLNRKSSGIDGTGPSVGVKPVTAAAMINAQVAGIHQGMVTSSLASGTAAVTVRSSKIKSGDGSNSKAKLAGKAASGPGGRPRDPRLATRQSVPPQTSVVANVVLESGQSFAQQVPVQDNAIFETVKLETAKPKPQITINIANKGNANKEPQGVSKKDPRLNSNKIHASNSKVRSDSNKSGGSSKGSAKSVRGSSPMITPQSPSRLAKQVPLSRKVHGKGSITNETSQKLASLIDLTDSPPYKTVEKKDEEFSGKDKDSHVTESLTKSSTSSSSSTSSGSSSSSSPVKKDSHKNKSSNRSPLDKKKGSGKGVKVGPGGATIVRSSLKMGIKNPLGSVRRSRERDRDRERLMNKKLDIFETEADSPSPPPPPVISDTKKREDTTFKDVKVSKKGRNYVRRNRQAESRSPEPAPGASGDVDLRLGGPPEKHPRMNAFQTDTSAAVNEDSKKTLVDPATKDVDLRPLSRSPNKKRPSMERSDQPPNKKSKAEMIDVLFGNEDVDLRQLPTISVVAQSGMPPSPPPPPIISQPSPTQPSVSQDSSTGSGSPKPLIVPDKEAISKSNVDGQGEDSRRSKENGENKSFRGWEKYKESRPDIYKSPFRNKVEAGSKSNSPRPDAIFPRQGPHFNRHVGDQTDGLGRPLLYHRMQENAAVDRRHPLGLNPTASPGEDTDMRTPLIDPDTLEDLDANISIIVQQAEEQLRNGSMNFEQYNTLLQQVIQMNELQKLREAKRRDQQENNDFWERSNRGRRGGEMGKGSPRSEDENSRDSLPGGRFGDIDERFPVVKLRGQSGGSMPSPPDSQWSEMPPHHGRPGVWDQPPPPPPPWARGMGPAGALGPMPGPGPGPRFPPMMHGAPPFHPRGPNNFGVGHWRPNQFPRPGFDGEMDGRFEQFNMRFPRAGGPQTPQHPPPPQLPHPPLPQLQHPPPQLPLPPPLQKPTLQQLASGELPLAEAPTLEAIAQDSMRTINIDSIPREIRYYGDTAIVMLSWDDPREISFQGGSSRRISFDNEAIICNFNDPYHEFVIDGCTHRVRLGAPTRELYIDGKWHECFFGGTPIPVEMGGKRRMVKLDGPPPQVKIGMVKRTDLVAGKINLIINARNMVPIFLDAKPQKFDIEGKPHVLRFTHALTSVVINGRSFKVEFGGLPMPIVVRGKKHFIRFSVLPRGVQPGYISIVNMEGGRLPSPTRPDGEGVEGISMAVEECGEKKLRKVTEPALPMYGRNRQRRFSPGQESPSEAEQQRNSAALLPTDPQKRPKQINQLPLEMLTSLMPVSLAPSSGYSYQVELESQDGQLRGADASTTLAGVTGTVVTSATGPEVTSVETTAAVPATLTPTSVTNAPVVATVGIPFLLPEINVEELFRKLVATGIVPTSSTAADEAKKKKEEDNETVKFVDFNQPETLKVRQPALIAALYSGIQCSSCGVRFAPEQTMKYSQHLDWHFRQNRRDRDNTRKAQSRKWYYDISDWIQFEEIEDLEERAQSWFETQQAAEGAAEEKEPVEIPSVPAGDSAEDVCCVCHDQFEQFYNEDTEEWHLRKAIRVDGKTYHPLCYEDLKANLERSLEEASAADESKAGENEDEKTEKEKDTEEGKEEEKKDGETKVESEEMDTSPTDSAPEDKEVKSEEKEETEKEAKVKVDIKEEPQEDKTEPMQIESDSTVAKTEKVKVEEGEPPPPGEEEALAVVIPPTLDTTHTEVACSIDGNVKFEDKPQNSLPGPTSGKIKINITKTLPPPAKEEQSSEGNAESSVVEGNTENVEAAAVQPSEATKTEDTKAASKEIVPHAHESLQPPPPGIEPVQVKPRLVGRKMTELPPVLKGQELSGLCSIM